MNNTHRRRELAAFLRSRRERLSPDDVGLMPGCRRRTPGLRREEVASLAGVGLEWYTWIEQARNINVSDDVLRAICRALLLSDDEQSHVFTMARGLRRAVSVSLAPVLPIDQAMLDALEPNPAHIRDHAWNLLAWNRSFERLTGFGQIPPEERNLLRLIFTNHEVVQIHRDWTHELDRDWDSTAAFGVAQFRYESAFHLDTPEVRDVVDELLDLSPAFSEFWDRHEVSSGEGSRTVWSHPAAGLLSFRRAVFPIGPSSDPSVPGGMTKRLNVLLPEALTATDERLRDLVSA